MTSGAQRAVRDAAGTADRASRSRGFRVLVTVGLIAFGVIHLVVGWIALQLAWGGSGGEEADQQGAIAQLAATPVGTPLLWVLGIGLFALALWQLALAVRGRSDLQGRKALTKRLTAAGKVVVYAGLGIAAVRAASGGGSGGGSGGSGNSKEEGLTARLMAMPFGRVLVGVVAVVVVVVGVVLVLKGVREKFLEDLEGDPGPAGRWAGRIGYAAKGVATAIIGGLFGWAALSYDPAKAGGLDDALQTVASGPVGPYLLTLLALGFVAFGVYCFFWSRRPKI